MTKRVIIFLATGVLAVCLLSGGCLKTDENKISEWKDLFKIPVSSQKDDSKTEVQKKAETGSKDVSDKESLETLSLQLYFANVDSTKLVVEERKIEKVEGIARRTVEELLEGPARKEYINVLPEGTRLLDINVRPDGICIVDLSAEVSTVDNQQQEKLIVYAITNTLSQFPTIETVKFRIDGKDVETLGGYVQLGSGAEADYQI